MKGDRLIPKLLGHTRATYSGVGNILHSPAIIGQGSNLQLQITGHVGPQHQAYACQVGGQIPGMTCFHCARILGLSNREAARPLRKQPIFCIQDSPPAFKAVLQAACQPSLRESAQPCTPKAFKPSSTAAVDDRKVPTEEKPSTLATKRSSDQRSSTIGPVSLQHVVNEHGLTASLMRW